MSDMREAMPQVAAFIDEMRAAFGADEINAQIRGGMRGLPTFWAKENGHEVGTPLPEPDPAKTISAADMVLVSNADLIAALKKR